MNKASPDSKVVLVILDGWGVSNTWDCNAVAQAETPNIDELMSNYPTCRLLASGESVGLMPGQMGDSNVGHLNLGAGRIVYQYVQRINLAIADGSFAANPELQKVMAHVRERGSALHLMGLLSPGGVHSHSDHLYALLRLAKESGVDRVFIHCFLDGRDVPPASAVPYMEELLAKTRTIGIGRVATVMGRYYAMDRDNRWERVEKAWQAMVLGQGRKNQDPVGAIKEAYERGETDEFVTPTVVCEGDEPVAVIQDGDGVLFFNFRADRARQITRAFIDQDFTPFPRRAPKVYFAGMTCYDEEFDIPFAFPPQDMRNTLGEVVSRLGWKQLRIAETEKYAHVTFFFSGGQEDPFPGETRRLIPSPKVATYDLKPEMSAIEVTDAVEEELASTDYQLVVLNYANLDMVGHTGIIEAAIKAVETVDRCVGRVVAAARRQGAHVIITSDHGNAELMKDPDTKQPHTAHTTNQVPLILVSDKQVALRDGILADVAPTILELYGVEKPVEMTGSSLIKKEE